MHTHTCSRKFPQKGFSATAGSGSAKESRLSSLRWPQSGLLLKAPVFESKGGAHTQTHLGMFIGGKFLQGNPGKYLHYKFQVVFFFFLSVKTTEKTK